MPEASTNSNTDSISPPAGITSPGSQNPSESTSRIAAQMKAFQESRKIGTASRPQDDESSALIQCGVRSWETNQGSAGQPFAKLTHPPATVSQPKILVSSRDEIRDGHDSAVHNNGSISK